MYRFLTILLCLRAAAAAPQSIDSDVTYVKIQPVVEDNVQTATNIRESRIETLPLTIPGNVSTGKDPDQNATGAVTPIVSDAESVSKETQADLTESESELTEVLDDQHLSAPTNTKPDLNEETATIESNSDTNTATSELSSDLAGSDDTSPSKISPDLKDSENSDPSILTLDLTETDSAQSQPNRDLSESDSENVSDTVLLETQSDRQARHFDSAETTEIADITERLEIDHIIEITTKSPPKFVPKAKSSYFQKPKVFQSYSSNFVENSPRRRFRSRCRCEKIWNCPKLQISVPRCPNEYFLCCF